MDHIRPILQPFLLGRAQSPTSSMIKLESAASISTPVGDMIAKDPRPRPLQVAELSGKTRIPPSLARRIHCFPSAPTREKKARRRARLTLDDKMKAREVRLRRACLRCKMLKIQCSGENPCTPCMSSAVRGYERKVLSFCYCIRTRFAEVNIFQDGHSSRHVHRYPVLAIHELLARIEKPALASQESSDIGEELVHWLTNPSFSLPHGSIIGKLCSNLDPLNTSAAVDADLSSAFPSFLFSSSATFAGWRARGITHRDFRRCAQASGMRVIQELDRILTPQYLAKANRETGEWLLLAVLGIILGVGYSKQTASAPAAPNDMPRSDFQQSPTLWLAMKEHLCHMLAHHLIFLGSLLGVKLETGVEQRIIDNATRRWNKDEWNMWGSVIKPAPTEDPQITAEFDYVEKRESQKPPSLVAVQCPDIAEIPHHDTIHENPSSYLSMTDDFMEQFGVPPRATTWSPNVASYEPETEVPFRKVRSRSVWVVRPWDNGSDGITNVHARFRMKQGEGIGLFA